MNAVAGSTRRHLCASVLANNACDQGSDLHIISSWFIVWKRYRFVSLSLFCAAVILPIISHVKLSVCHCVKETDSSRFLSSIVPPWSCTFVAYALLCAYVYVCVCVCVCVIGKGRLDNVSLLSRPRGPAEINRWDFVSYPSSYHTISCATNSWNVLSARHACLCIEILYWLFVNLLFLKFGSVLNCVIHKYKR